MVLKMILEAWRSIFKDFKELRRNHRKHDATGKTAYKQRAQRASERSERSERSDQDETALAEHKRRRMNSNGVAGATGSPRGLGSLRGANRLPKLPQE